MSLDLIVCRAPLSGDSGETNAYQALLAGAQSLLNGDADGNATGDANDMRGAFHGTWIGTPAYGSAPPDKGAGKSFLLNGTNQAVTQVSGACNFTDNFTIAAWIKASALDGRIFSKRIDASYFIEFYLNANGSLTLFDTPGFTYSSAAAAIGVGAWNHVALVIDGADSRIYVNGAPSGAAFNPAIVANSQVVSWGFLNSYGGLGWFAGEMYQCGIWGRALTAEECALLHAG